MGRLQFDVRFSYPGGFEINAHFEAGEGVTALFGPSGCGKSTIMNLIAGGLHPLTGTIRLGERILVDTQAHVFLPPEQRRVGVVLQDHLLFPHMTVRKNLLFGKGRQGSRAIDFAKVVDILEITDLLDRMPATLSGGQHQRVAVGRAILRGPELLLMDEPIAALDQGLKDRILTYLERAFAEWHIPTVFVSHNRADVSRLADHVVYLEAGRVSCSGPPAKVLCPESLRPEA
jgi:molybdate transport system ATP-binding protein